MAPVTLAYNIGFRAKELRDIRRLVSEHAADPSLRSSSTAQSKLKRTGSADR
jgi:hypothetical protein